MHSDHPHATTPPDPPDIGDHLALDLLNTEARGRDGIVDHWRTEDDVLRWLARHEVVPPSPAGRAAPHDLLARARTLRTHARDLIAGRKASGTGEIGDIGPLNGYLRAYATAPELSRDDSGRLRLIRVAETDATASLLGPVAEAVADLLVAGDFALVRQCEHPDCILWFYDRTKSHRRRWCSMAQCGNRQKAARFRRQKKENEDR